MLEGLRTRYRRWKLRRAYSKLVAARSGADGPLSNYVATRHEMARDGVITFDDGEVIWNWPDEWQDGL